MAKQFTELKQNHIEFIKAQHIFFVSTAGAQGYVNSSPKGLDSLRIVHKKNLHWLNLTGSGNESAAHVLENQRMTLMFCSFDKQPLILRIYGKANMIYKNEAGWDELLAQYPAGQTGARQIFTMDIEMVQTSCGYAVPYYDFVGDRDVLTKWADKASVKGIEEYWQEKTNSV